MKKFAALILALVLALAAVSALAESTYIHNFAAEELAGTTDMNGFVSALALTERNTVVLKDDGTYEYTKLMAYINEAGEVIEVESENGTMRFEIRYTYTGTYTQDGDQVTLNVPDECVFSEDWGVLVAGGYMKNSEGKASEGARVVNYEGTDFDPMDNFGSQVYKFVGHDAPVSITVNADGTFNYNAVASSDDD
jgi:hypothetical protein